MPATKKLPHILLVYVDEIRSDLLHSFVETVRSPNLELIVESRPPLGPQASLVWLVPTAVMIYLTKSYFDGFLKEAGKDHYQLVKEGIAFLWKNFFGKDRVVRASLIGSQGKARAAEQYSVTISIMADADAGLRFKLLLQEDISAEELSATVGRFLEFLKNYYTGSLDKSMLARLSSARVVGRTLLVARDRENDVFIFLDPVPNLAGKGLP